jgi:hypothetical protein
MPDTSTCTTGKDDGKISVTYAVNRAASGLEVGQCRIKQVSIMITSVFIIYSYLIL